MRILVTDCDLPGTVIEDTLRAAGLRAERAASGSPDDIAAAGADVDVRDNDGDTALMFVMEQNSPRPIWEALIAKSKDLNIAHNRGMTALHYAARLPEDPAVIQAMLKAGADPRKADSAGQTPIDVARERGRADFVKLMGKQ